MQAILISIEESSPRHVKVARLRRNSEDGGLTLRWSTKAPLVVLRRTAMGSLGSVNTYEVKICVVWDVPIDLVVFGCFLHFFCNALSDLFMRVCGCMYECEFV